MIELVLRSNEMHRFSSSRCVFVISLGQKYHEGEQLLATIQSLKIFESVVIVIADSLQRHTWKIKNPDDSDQEIERKLAAESFAWQARNQEITSLLGDKLKDIITWDEWRLGKNFERNMALIESHYKKDELFKKAVDSSVGSFVRTFFKRKNAGKWEYSDTDPKVMHSRAFVLEECAAYFSWREREEEYNFILYPGLLNQAQIYTLKKYIYPQCPDTLNLSIIESVFIKRKTLFLADGNDSSSSSSSSVESAQPRRIYGNGTTRLTINAPPPPISPATSPPVSPAGSPPEEIIPFVTLIHDQMQAVFKNFQCSPEKQHEIRAALILQLQSEDSQLLEVEITESVDHSKPLMLGQEFSLSQ